MTEHTLSLSDQILISEVLGRASNELKTEIVDSMTITVVLDSAYKIIRIGETGFIRSQIY
jgi:uncharacterized protein YbcI